MRVSPEKKEEKERIRHALLRATLRLAAVHGFASLGLREVSRAADIAPTSFYRHFADMDELGRALVLDFFAPVRKRVSERVSRTSDAVVALLDACLLLAHEDTELARFYVAERHGASASLRSVLAQEHDALSITLHKELGASWPRAAAVAAVVLITEAMALALDTAPEALPALREQQLLSLRWLVGDASGARRQS